MTPWGRIQTEHVISGGMALITTASHGGFRLNESKNREVLKNFPGADPIERDGFFWYEEDIDFAFVIASFPGEFSPYDVYCASRLFDTQYMYDHKQCYNENCQNAAITAKQFMEDNADKWQVMTCSSHKGGVRIMLSRLCDEKRMTIQAKEFPSKSLLSDVEIKELAIRADGS